MSFAVGSLVTARGREWVVQPDPRNSDVLLIVRPLVGGDDEVTGLFLPFEEEGVKPAVFPPPDPASELGDHRSGALLRDAMRLGLRSGAGPFRCLGAVAVEPRPYQLVPLLMALRLDPVRLLIADDVGVGKSVEACLIARELLDRGEIERIGVLCPPHLAEQWQRTLADQFQVDAALVLPGTVRRLEKQAGLGSHQSLFSHYRHVVVSLDYVKSKRHRQLFVDDAPELLIVDEAHTCAAAPDDRGQRHLRHELLTKLVERDDRHLLLVTATPHSGKDAPFRALLTLLDPDFADLPPDLSGDVNRRHRERLARHLVQRRRADLARYLRADTPFPERETAEETYTLSPEYRRFFDKLLDWCRESMTNDASLGEFKKRVRWWSALALLRSFSSSPRAAAATLHNRTRVGDTQTPEEADDAGRRMVFDLDEETNEGIDIVPGGQTAEEDAEGAALRERQRFLRLAREAEKLEGEADRKIRRAGDVVERLLADGFSPIVFCRFIPTAHYVAENLRLRLGPHVEVAAVTGELVPEAREREVDALGEKTRRVLVCTDCLSEGINLQQRFNAVVHYDLSWNPTRHEQREGRVDRFGQKLRTIRTVTFFGKDNPVDGVVLKVLYEKHLSIREQLGISVPVPMGSNEVLEAVLEGLIMRRAAPVEQLTLDFVPPLSSRFQEQWQKDADRLESNRRSLFAQNTIDENEVEQELRAARDALGDETTVRRFTREALLALKAGISEEKAGVWEVGLEHAPRALRETVGQDRLRVGLDENAGAPALVRTHPLVAATAEHVWNAALDPQIEGPARRCGVIRTAGVERRTVLLLLRMRFHLDVRDRRGQPRALLAEEVVPAAYRGAAEGPDWLTEEETRALFDLRPDENTLPDLARRQLERVRESLEHLEPKLAELAREHGERLLEAHRRVRRATVRRDVGSRSVDVEATHHVDVLAMYVYLPVRPGGAP